VKFVFGAKPEFLSDLMKHIYSTSVAEVVKNILNVSASNFDFDLQKTIKSTKAMMMDELLDKLSSSYSEENSMCAHDILMFLM
jgi:hypothetical protein